jgi:hypothetical protein
MIGYELDLKSFGFQKLMESNAQRVTAGKGVFPIQKIIG